MVMCSTKLITPENGEETENHEINFIGCQVFTTEESRVAARHIIKLMTPENIQVVERWLDRLKKAESSVWELLVRFAKLVGFMFLASIVYHLSQPDFISWLKRFWK